MTTKIDKFGRVVIPKAARQSLGLRAGDVLSVQATNGQLHLALRNRHRGLVRVNGVLVCDGEFPKGFDVDRFITEERIARERHVLGDWKP